MAKTQNETVKFPAKTKIFFSAALLLIVATVIIVLVISSKPPELIIEEVNPIIGDRPVSTQEYEVPVFTDPQYATPVTGKGIEGPEKPELEGDSSYFLDLYLPFVDVINLPAGQGFNAIAEDLNAGDVYKAVIYPKGSDASSPVAFESGTGTVDSKGMLEFDVALPTNLSLGAYILEVSGPGNTFQTDFVIRPAK